MTSKLFKNFICILSCIFIVFASISLCFASGYLPEYSSTPSIAEITSSPVYFYNDSNIPTYFAVNSSNTNVDYIYYYNSRNAGYEHLLISNTSSFTCYRYNTSYNNVDASGSIHQQSNNYYYISVGTVHKSNSGALDEDMFAFIPDVYNSTDAITYAFSHTLEYPTNVVDMTGNGYLSQGLKVGNVIYFDIGSGNTFDIELISDFNSKSGWLSNVWVNDNRKYGFSDSLPTTSTTFDNNSGSSISWSEFGSTDLLGRASQGKATLSGTASNRYLWIVNPLYNNGYYDNPEDASSLNGNITYIGGIAPDTVYYTYPLKQSATSIGLASDVATTVGGIGSVTNDGTTNTVINDGTTSGAIYTQPVGGSTAPPETVSAVEGIRQTLDQFINGITNLFTAPISHINQLLTIGGQFLQNISGIWAWLPSPIPEMVITGLLVVLAIGVLHTLL